MRVRRTVTIANSAATKKALIVIKISIDNNFNPISVQINWGKVITSQARVE
jgi:hypothetical protein